MDDQAMTAGGTSAATAPSGVDPQLLAQVSSGGSWFYWVAALSLVNSVLLAFGSDRSFVIGLGVTQIIDAIASSIGGGIVKALALVIDLGVAGIFGLFGYYACRRQTWAFLAGMILYLGDGLLYLLVGDWLSVAFHVFVLVSIFAGFSAHRKLTAAESTLPPGIR